VLGVVRSGDIGVQGVSSAPGALLPVTLQAALPAGAAIITATTTASGNDTARLDAVMIEPFVSRYVLGGGGHGSALLRGASRITENTTVASPAKGAAVIDAHKAPVIWLWVRKRRTPRRCLWPFRLTASRSCDAKPGSSSPSGGPAHLQGAGPSRWCSTDDDTSKVDDTPVFKRTSQNAMSKMQAGRCGDDGSRRPHTGQSRDPQTASPNEASS
jgi:hypothetical protein